MTPWQDRRAADRLDEAIEAMLTGRDADESSARRVPASELAAAGTLLAARPSMEEHVAPDPAYASSLRIRLVAEAERLAAERAAVVPTARTQTVRTGPDLQLARPTTRRPRLVAGFTAAAILATTGAAAAVGAQGALPGEALYPVKLGVERLSLVGDSPAEAGRERLDHAATRLAEAAELVARNDPGDVERAGEAVSDFSARATQGGAALLAADVDGEAGAAQDVRAFARDARQQLVTLSENADGDLFTALKTAADTVYVLDAQVDALCPTCTGEARPLAPFAQAVEQASRILMGVSGVDVTAEETRREAAERIAADTPRVEVDEREGRAGARGDRGGSRPGDRADTPRQQQPAQSPTAPSRPRLPAVSDLPLSEVPVVGSTLEEVTDVVEKQVVREVEKQVGTLTDDLGKRLGDTLGGLTGGGSSRESGGSGGSGGTGLGGLLP
ncbi:hypothetical protein KLP28_05095 [Nocardioidaceae bacterium]|nr:hypothetical protein KLP28_05095 [Nocardioidaceae bacterium]